MAADPVQAILDTIPTEARAPGSTPTTLPAGVDPGHCYSYSGADRMGTCWVSDSGALSAKPRGGGIPHSWAAANAAGLTWRHADLACGCGR